MSNYTFEWLQNRTNNELILEYDFIMFLGDMAYDLESNDCM